MYFKIFFHCCWISLMLSTWMLVLLIIWHHLAFLILLAAMIASTVGSY
jgi:hypothetical protein